MPGNSANLTAMSDAALDNKVAIVTGAGRGIGRAVSMALAAAGADVAITSRTLSELEEVSAAIRLLGRRSICIAADVASEPDCLRVVETAVAELGGLDILVNNAGTAIFGELATMATSDFDLHYQVNTRGTFLLSRAALGVMLAQHSGVIINVASTSGKKPYPLQGAYCASKAAILAMTRVMAMETRDHGIRVAAVCPGAVDTTMADQIHPHRDRTGWLQPENVADAVLALCALPANVAVDEIVIRRHAADPVA